MTRVIFSAKCLNWPEIAPFRDAFSRETTRSSGWSEIFRKMSQQCKMTQQNDEKCIGCTTSRLDRNHNCIVESCSIEGIEGQHISTMSFVYRV